MDTGSFLWGCFAGAFAAWTLALTVLVVFSYQASKKDEDVEPEKLHIPKQRATRDDIR